LVQAEPWACVFRAETPDGSIWFKACAPTHAFEVPLTSSLASRWPHTVTDVLAYDVDRRWLLMADAGEPLRTLGNPPERWEAFLPSYAELQIGETAHVGDHLASGTPDLRLERLPELFHDLVAAELPLDRTERAELGRFAVRFGERCRELETAGIGPSVQHDDLHMNNLYVQDQEMRVLDWGDASIGHPFFSLFEVFRFLSEVNGLPSSDPWFARLRDAYLEPWGSDAADAFDIANVVGGYAHSIAWLRQRDALTEDDRRVFDEAYSVILRIALRAGR
jgi:phosphotransferase family enzyme